MEPVGKVDDVSKSDILAHFVSDNYSSSSCFTPVQRVEIDYPRCLPGSSHELSRVSRFTALTFASESATYHGRMDRGGSLTGG